jgi:hypothetical protein
MASEKKRVLVALKYTGTDEIFLYEVPKKEIDAIREEEDREGIPSEELSRRIDAIGQQLGSVSKKYQFSY